MDHGAKYSFNIIDTGGSRSFGLTDAFRQFAIEAAADVAIVIGTNITHGLARIEPARFAAILIELQTENLGAHISEDFGREGGNILGFNRFRLGLAPASNLIEIIVQPATREKAISAAIAIFQDAGLTTVACKDTPGRIVDRLIRPYFNQALAALDDGLADAGELDRALMLGLGYRRGPVDLLTESGLEDHFRVSTALYQATGEAACLPARRARTASERLMKERVHE